MKTIITTVIIIIILLSCINSMNHYKVDATVTSIENNIVTFKTVDGNLWEWEREQNEVYFIGDSVTLKMWNYGTDHSIQDDEIEEVIKNIK